tara:strand:+ start:13038 stop:13364 length:327 start_codon:yes stop_codon:yes gene_type:complete
MFDSTDESFETDVTSTEIVIFDVWASWCQPCKMFAPIFEGLATKLKSYTDIKFFKLNADKCPSISAKLNITSIPSVLYYKDGELVEMKNGIQTEEQMIEMINGLRKKK